MTVTTAIAQSSPPLPGSFPRSLRIVLPGGSGHLGRILARYLVAKGHRVLTLTRNRDFLLGEPLTPAHRTVRWDGRTLDGWVRELDGANVIVNLAGRTVDCRYSPRNREEILESRVASTAVLGTALRALRQPPRVWLNASTATIYRDSYDLEMDEAGELGGSEPRVPPSWKFSIEVARCWERALFDADTPFARKVALRTAMVMSPEPGAVFSTLLRLTRMGLGGRWGNGRQWMSWIHEQDFCRAVEFLIEDESLSGVVNLAAPAPVPNSEFLATLREAYGIAFGIPSSEWMLSVGAFLARTETELLLKSRRVVPQRLLQHGFRFLFPEWPQAARDLVHIWRSRQQSQERRAT